MKITSVLLSMSVYFLLASFNKKNSIYQVNPITACIDDTVWQTRVKPKTIHKNADSVKGSGLPILFPVFAPSPRDPDDVVPVTKPGHDDTANRARDQMKTYLDSLVVSPCSTRMKIEKAMLSRRLKQYGGHRDNP